MPPRELCEATVAREGMVALASADDEEKMVFDDARNRKLEGPTRFVLALVEFFAACFGPALVGSAFTAPSILEWYESLSKPFFTPPS